MFESFRYRKVLSLSINQRFNLVRVKAERYDLHFYENAYHRKVSVVGNAALGDIWQGTEFYAFLVKPWKDWNCSTAFLIRSTETLKAGSKIVMAEYE